MALRELNSTQNRSRVLNKPPLSNVTWLPFTSDLPLPLQSRCRRAPPSWPSHRLFPLLGPLFLRYPLYVLQDLTRPLKLIQTSLRSFLSSFLPLFLFSLEPIPGILYFTYFSLLTCLLCPLEDQSHQGRALGFVHGWVSSVWNCAWHTAGAKWEAARE